MRLAYTALILVLLPMPVAAQEPADFFGCIDAVRLTVPRTATYKVTGSADYVDVEDVVPVQLGERKALRITRTRYRDNAMTAAQIMHVDARTLAPLSFLHKSARTPNDPPADLVVQPAADGRPGRLTGRSYGNQAVSVDTKGEPVLFGNAPEQMLAAAIDWDRCARVSAMTLNVSDLTLERRLTMRRSVERTVSLEGREVPAYEIVLSDGKYESTLVITKAAPFVVFSVAHSLPSTTSRLVTLTHTAR